MPIRHKQLLFNHFHLVLPTFLFLLPHSTILFHNKLKTFFRSKEIYPSFCRQSTIIHQHCDQHQIDNAF
ncbi:unnamed protein product [Lactuca virosa]|uniref:Uncharacterized protein n=1 Tax=Lactuca virosa TaxID=75947 RepID=A0AAU9MY03_9ASTR|nr:unnamed protein product [Lactuca virosa]